MAKMFYTLVEAAKKLQIPEERIKSLVRDGQLREFRDAGKVNFKVEEVENLVASMGTGPAGASGELILEPGGDSSIGDSSIGLVDTGTGTGIGAGSDILSLEEADKVGTKTGDKSEKEKKDDTVVTSVGVNVFDDDEELEDVDPLAQTVVTEGAAGLGLDGSDSGSGLLDLTRESDDTSLGDLLEELSGDDNPVEMGEATRAGLEEAITEEDEETGETEELFPETHIAAAAAIRTRTVVEYGPDAMTTGLTGAIAIAIVAMGISGLGVASSMQGVWPAFLDVLNEKMWIFGLASVAVSGIAWGIGYFLAKR